ncbi:hypothetical protein [Mesorhizobium sp. WSM4303]|uniref:hypothetical protein n=1 Tax=Mesorhizobium sp. WSM4303 TaxID=2589887 RepID=UPI00163D80FC|nr:hypothetical protein [Mesorhizobium sp. WSM4303]
MEAPKVVSLKEAKEQAARKKYAALVLSKFDDFEHADKREFLQRKAEVENASRQRL